jgi:hypothetical protein
MLLLIPKDFRFPDSGFCWDKEGTERGEWRARPMMMMGGWMDGTGWEMEMSRATSSHLIGMASAISIPISISIRPLSCDLPFCLSVSLSLAQVDTHTQRVIRDTGGIPPLFRSRQIC